MALEEVSELFAYLNILFLLCGLRLYRICAVCVVLEFAIIHSFDRGLRA